MNRFIIVLLLLTGCGSGQSSPNGSCESNYLTLPYTAQQIAGYTGTWSMNANQLIPASSDPARFDAGYTSTAKVVYDDSSGNYLLFYTGGVLVDRPGREMFGLAIATNPEGPYVKYNGGGDRGSLFSLGDAGRYDHDRMWGMGTVLVEDGVWKMWTIGDSDSTENHVASVGYAVSHDRGLTWIKQYSSRPSGAIFEDTDGCNAGSRGVLAFSVIHEPDGYYAFYYTFASNAIRVAFSRDGVNDWIILGKANIQVSITGLGNVVKINGVYYLSANSLDYKRLVVMKSGDKINWDMHEIVSISSEPWQSGWIAFPYLLLGKDCNLYMFYTAAPYDDSGLNGRIGSAKINQL